MACVTRLKDDTRFLECTFPRTHKLFQISSATVDEVVCRFVVTGEQDTRPGQAIVLTANFGVRLLYLLYGDPCRSKTALSILVVCFQFIPPEMFILTEILQMCRLVVFSKRQRITLRLLYAIGRPSVVCLSVCLSVCLTVVCDVGAPYSGG